MGLLPCPLPCQSYEDSDSHQFHSSNNLHSSYSSLSSQPSLPSIPSLTSLSSSSTTTHHHCITTLNHHSSSVFSLTLAGKHLYSGSSTSEIHKSSRDPSTLDHSSTTTTVVASGDSAVKSIAILGDKLFSAHQDHKIRVWKIDNNDNQKPYKIIATLPTLNDRAAKLFWAKNYVEVRRHKKSTWVHHVDTVSGLALSQNGSQIFSVSWDRTFKVWSTSHFKCLESVQNAHDDAINAIVLSTDGFVYTGSADKKIKVWKKKEGEKRHSLIDTLEKHKSAVNALAISTDGSVLYSGACDRSIIVWEKNGGGGDGGDGGGCGNMVVVGALRGHTKAILCLAVVSDLICSGSADKTVRIWRKGIERSYSCLAVLEGHRGPVKCLAAAVDSCNGESNPSSGTSYKVYSGSLDRDIKVWQIWVPFL
ncbi:hypothetical protein ACSBR2_036105 [Camellia fascicularis]